MSGANDDDAPKLSKRQRRARGSNSATTWQQQPRFKSAEARARAYISYAGLADDGDRADGEKVRNNGSANGGIGNGKKPSTIPIDPELDLHSPEVKFGRLLGGSDQRSRHAAVKMLGEYLRARSDIAKGAGFSELDLLKLWKGLWYTLYMADKVPVQDKLSKILAELMWCLSGTEEEDEHAGQIYLRIEEGEVDKNDEDGMSEEATEIAETDKENYDHDNNAENDGDEEGEDEEEVKRKQNMDVNGTHCRGAHLVSLYVSTFLRTIQREWGNVDKHRVDKFYTAVRFMVSEVYKYMSKRHWNLGIVRLFNDVLYSEGLSFDTPGLTNGLRYHLVDICLEELAKVNGDAGLQLTEATFLDCLEPFFALAQRAEDRNVQKRVMENVLLKFLDQYSFVSPEALMAEEGIDDGEEKVKDEALIFRQVHVGTVAKFIFEIASDNNTDERYRKSLYDMHKAYKRRVRAVGRDVDLDQYLSEEEDEDHDGEEAAWPSGNGNDSNDDICANKPFNDDEDGKQQKEKQKARKEKQVAANLDEQRDAEEKISSPVPTFMKEAVDDVTSCVKKHEPGKKKKKKKKRSMGGNEERSKDDTVGDAPGTPVPSKEEKPVEILPKVNSSSKKKRKVGGDGPETQKKPTAAASTGEENSVATTATITQTRPSLSKKKSKKQEDSTEKAVDDVTSCVKKQEPGKKKKKTKKQGMGGNKKRSKDDTAADAPGTPIPSKEEEPAEILPKDNSSSKKKRKACSDGPETQKEPTTAASTGEENSVATMAKIAQTRSSLSEKKNKKQEDSMDEEITHQSTIVKTPTPKPKGGRKQKSPPLVDPRSMHSPDGDVDDDDDSAVALSSSKRVSFGKMNRCISHKASMKAVKTLKKKQWDTVSRTPDKGILRPKAVKASEDADKSSARKRNLNKKKKKGW